MKYRTDFLLLGGLLLSGLVFLWVLLFDISLIFYAAILPAFFLQLVLCRFVSNRTVRHLPLVLSAILSAVGLALSAVLFWLPLYIVAISLPAAIGCLLGLLTWKWLLPLFSTCAG